MKPQSAFRKIADIIMDPDSTADLEKDPTVLQSALQDPYLNDHPEEWYSALLLAIEIKNIKAIEIIINTHGNKNNTEWYSLYHIDWNAIYHHIEKKCPDLKYDFLVFVPNNAKLISKKSMKQSALEKKALENLQFEMLEDLEKQNLNLIEKYEALNVINYIYLNSLYNSFYDILNHYPSKDNSVISHEVKNKLYKETMMKLWHHSLMLYQNLQTDKDTALTFEREGEEHVYSWSEKRAEQINQLKNEIETLYKDELQWKNQGNIVLYTGTPGSDMYDTQERLQHVLMDLFNELETLPIVFYPNSLDPHSPNKILHSLVYNTIWSALSASYALTNEKNPTRVYLENGALYMESILWNSELHYLMKTVEQPDKTIRFYQLKEGVKKTIDDLLNSKKALQIEYDNLSTDLSELEDRLGIQNSDLLYNHQNGLTVNISNKDTETQNLFNSYLKTEAELNEKHLQIEEIYDKLYKTNTDKNNWKEVPYHDLKINASKELTIGKLKTKYADKFIKLLDKNKAKKNEPSEQPLPTIENPTPSNNVKLKK